MRKFKVGDKVICIDNSQRTHEIVQGDIYKITALTVNSSNDKCFRIQVPDGDKKMFLRKRFKLANSHIIKERLKIK